MTGRRALPSPRAAGLALLLVFGILTPSAVAQARFVTERTKHFAFLGENPVTGQTVRETGVAMEAAWSKLPGGEKSALALSLGRFRVQVSIRRYDGGTTDPDWVYFSRDGYSDKQRVQAKGKTLVALTGRHFRVVFLKEQGDSRYAVRVLDDLETAWQGVVKELKYRKPKTPFKIDCYITPVVELSPAAAGRLTWREQGRYAAVIYTDVPQGYARYVPASFVRQQVRSTLLHEFFHVEQFEYMPKGKRIPRWLREGSARWIETELQPGTKYEWIPARIGSKRSSQNLVPWWWYGRGGLMELGRWYEQTGGPRGTHGLEWVSYQSATFLQFAVQHKGSTVVRKMWEAIAAGKTSGFDAAYEALGGRPEMRRLYGEFAAGLVVRTRDRSPYGFLPLTDVMTEPVQAILDGKGAARPRYPRRQTWGVGPETFPLTADRRHLSPVWREGNKLGIQLIEFRPKKPLSLDGDGKPEQMDEEFAPDLIVAVRGASAKENDFAFSLVEIPTVFGSPWAVRPFDTGGKDVYRIGRAKAFGDQSAAVVLAAAHVPPPPLQNGTETGSDGMLSFAALLTPPVVTDVKLFLPRAGQNHPVWHFRRGRVKRLWKPGRASPDGIAAEPGELTGTVLSATVIMSRSMESVQIGLARPGAKDLARVLELTPDPARTTWTVSKMKLADLLGGPKGERFTLGIRGIDLNGVRSDPVPATAVDLKPDLSITGWEELTEAQPGYERFDLHLVGRPRQSTWNVRCLNHQARWKVFLEEFPDGTLLLHDNGLTLRGKSNGVLVMVSCLLDSRERFFNQRWDRNSGKGDPSEVVLAEAGIKAEYRLSKKNGTEDVLEGLWIHHWYWKSDGKFVMDACSVVMKRGSETEQFPR